MSPNIRFIRPRNVADVEALVSKYHRWLRAAAIRMLRRARVPDPEGEADEILQEIYIAIWKNGINNVNSLEAYLMGMVRNKVVDRIRRPRRFYVELDETMEDGRVDVEKELETTDLVERAFSQLPPKDQQQLQEFIDGKSISLEIPVNTARSRKNRVMKKFREILDRVTKGSKS